MNNLIKSNGRAGHILRRGFLYIDKYAGQKAESSRDRTESSRPGGTQEISVSAKRKMIFISMTTMTMRKAKVTRM